MINGDYRQQLDRFITAVDDLPKEHLNYSCKSKVLGDRETVPFKEGIITRFIRQLEEEALISSRTLPTSNSLNSTQNLLSD